MVLSKEGMNYLTEPNNPTLTKSKQEDERKDKQQRMKGMTNK